MSDPIDITANITSPERASSFQQARKRLREARMRWIDENEKPVAMEYRDGSGKMVKSPFLTGCITATPEEIFAKENEKPKNFIDPKRSLSSVEDELDETIREYMAIEGIAVSGKAGDKVAYVSEVDRPQHPPILEGESHEEWFTRTTRAYAQAENPTAATGGSGADPDYLRRPLTDYPSDGRQTPSAGAEDRGREFPADIHREPGTDNVGGIDDAAAHPTANATSGSTAADGTTERTTSES